MASSLSSISSDAPSLGAYLATALVSGIAVGIIGLVVDRLVLSRLRNVDEAFMLVATFALMMTVTGVVTLIWGRVYYSVEPPELLASAVELAPVFIPTFSIFIVATGVALFVILELLIQKTWAGKLLLSVARDPWMVRLLGYKVTLIFAMAVFVAFLLAGLAGGLLVANQSVSPQLGDSYLMRAFIAIVIGGLGNIRGAFVASLLIGLLESVSAAVVPNLPGLSIYVAMILILIVRPQGLLGGSARAVDEIRTENTITMRNPTGSLIVGLALMATLMLAPFWAGAGVLFVIGLAVTQALFALSWNLLFGTAGILAFGHAAFYAIGAYGVGYLLKAHPEFGFLGILLLSTVLGAVLALVISIILLGRTSGIYFAITTLAVCQVCYIVIGYIPELGRDDGLAFIPRPSIELLFWTVDLAPAQAYFWFLVLSSALVTALLWWFTASRHGRTLRIIRQDAKRATFSGIDVRFHERRVFVISGAVAALAGGLSAPWSQIVTPELANIAHTTAPVLSTLLGGSGSFFGPIVGAFTFATISYSTGSFAGLSEFIMGTALLVIVLAAPGGVLRISVTKLFARFSHATRPAA